MHDIDTRRDIGRARDDYPATDSLAHFNTAAVGLASRGLAEAYHRTVDEWTDHGLESTRR